MDKLKSNINNMSLNVNKSPNKHNIYKLVPEFNQIEEIDSNNYCEETSNINKESNNLEVQNTIFNILRNHKKNNSNNNLINSQNNTLKVYKKNIYSFNDEQEKQNFRNLPIFKNANKLMSDFKIIREYKNKFKKMDNITLFYYNKNLKKKQLNKPNIINNNDNNKKSYLPEIVLEHFKEENKKLKKSNSQELNLDKIKENIEKDENIIKYNNITLNKNETLNKMKKDISEINKFIYESKVNRKNNINKFSNIETQFIKSKSEINLN